MLEVFALLYFLIELQKMPFFALIHDQITDLQRNIQIPHINKHHLKTDRNIE